MSNHLTRIYSSLSLLFIFLFCLLLGRFALLILVAVLLWKASKEYLLMAEKTGTVSSYSFWLVRVASIILAISACFSWQALNITLLVFILILFVVHVINISRSQVYKFFALPSDIFALIYTGWLPAHFLLLRHDLLDGDRLGGEFVNKLFAGEFTNIFTVFADKGIYFCLIIIVAIAFNDIAAYYFGKTFGKTPFSPVSPNKTLEGSIGGLFAGTLLFVILSYWGAHLWNIEIFLNKSIVFWLVFALIGLIFNLLAQAGDLMESILKRSVDVKDAGQIIQGQGGVLDRFDSHIVVVALYYILLNLFINS